MRLRKIFKKRSVVNLIKKLLFKLYVLLSYIRFINRRIYKTENKPKVLVSLKSGQKLLQILYQFINCGYICYIDISFMEFMETGIYGLKAVLLDNVYTLPRKCNKSQLIIASDNKEYLDLYETEQLKIFINRFIFKDLKKITDDDFFYPLLSHYYFMVLYNESDVLTKALGKERKIGSVFVGNADINSYKNELTKELFNINTRNETFYYIINKLPESILYIPETLNKFLKDIEAGNLRNRVVLLDTKKFTLPVDIYTTILLKSDFFIHMCGAIQPYCHNQIESMMTGCIPITQLTSFFIPPFQNEKNGLLFNNLDELIELLIKVSSGKYEDNILLMRKNITDYYNQHFSISTFRNKLSELLDKKIKYTNYYLAPSVAYVLNEPHLHGM